ncbi:sensor histidine kinase [Pseudonocardia sp. TRM90224]|uniref:sensor histidine kinase n=1 Tax=Pseudonocardia sp. TRM90224 TaxID=2812678 RepID=UPI001E4C856F|nr:histidine kinase [Pseudonocardia sp. TRM90224]
MGGGGGDTAGRPLPPVGWAEVGVEAGYRRARFVTSVALAVMLLTSVAMPAIGLIEEERPAWLVLGALGIVLFAAGLGFAMVGEFVPRHRGQRFAVPAFVLGAVLSVPLVGPLGAVADEWESWAWVGAAIVGAMPLLVRFAFPVVAAVAVIVLAVGVSAAIGWLNGGPLLRYVVITGGIGLGLALVNGLQIWLWRLVVQARDGQDAIARLTATEERLRFARDVHDVLGHDLSVIALKAELVARLCPIDVERAGAEAAEIQQLAAAALGHVRQAVHGYRTVELREQLKTAERVLSSAGVRCTIRVTEGELPAESAHLSPVLREAVTNMLRHSRAVSCTIDVDATTEHVRMTVTNDGVLPAAPDERSSGLRGLTERLAEVGGTLTTHVAAGTFTLVTVLPR